MTDVQTLFRQYLRLDRKRRTSALSQREYESWSQLKQQLNATFSPPTRPEHEERRDSVRVPVKLLVRFQSSGELQRCLLTNLATLLERSQKNLLHQVVNIRFPAQQA